MAKLILYRTPGPLPMLQPATAISIDNGGAFIVLAKCVDNEEGEPTNIVPASDCIEFDADLLDHVNALVQRAKDAMSSARQLLETRAIVVTVEGTEEPQIRH